MAAGRPVIAYAAGGALDTVIPGQTGWLFAEQSVQAIIEAVETADPTSLSPARIRQHAEQFDTAVFRRKISRFIEEKVAEWQSGEVAK
jgi:glycosyltransferase involved in cell wall biosynthesis